MHIKQVRIQGFKSYKEQTSTEPFSPRLNVVVGKNGSGKSNFFKAIEFVLGDEEEYKRLGAQGRQQLLHEGTGDRVAQAWVEIIFDNSDQRIPVDTEEFVLRRVVGTKKDQYLLNGKPTTKQDVTNMLETAGFSASNPYYIVKQGKVTEMATAKDKKRLELLREVAGTRAYDDKRTESEQILQTTEENIEDVKRVLDTIEEKLKALESEKEELRKHQQLDKKRRALEHTVYNREYEEVATKITKLREQRQRKDEEVNKCRTDLKKESARMQRLEAENQETAAIIEKTQDEIDQIRTESTECESQYTRLKLRIDDLDRKILDLKKQQEESTDDYQRLQADSIRVEHEIEQLKPQLKIAQDAESNARAELERCERRVHELQKKRGHGQRFKTREERNKYLEAELRKLSMYLKKQESTRQSLETYVRDDTQAVTTLEEATARLTITTKQAQDSIGQANDEFYAVKKTRDDLDQQRNAKQADESNLQKSLATMRRELLRKEQKFKHSVGVNALRGAEGVQQVVKRLGEATSEKYFGQLIEHVQCVEAVYNAVEVVGGGKLFNHLVADDRVASDIMEEFNRQKLPGELSMIPLSLLSHQAQRGLAEERIAEIQQRFGNDVRLLSELVQVDDERFTPAVRSVFAKYILCRKLEIATQVCREFDVDCVTQEGYTVQRSGVMSGGYLDRTHSKLAFYNEVRQLRDELAASEAAYQESRQAVQVLEDEWKISTQAVSREEIKLQRRHKDLSQMKDQLTQNREALRRKRDDIMQRERSLEENRQQIKSSREQMESLEREMQMDLATALSADEQAELLGHESSLRDQRQNVGKLANHANKLEGQVSEKRTFLEENVQRRLEELLMRTEEFEVAETEQQRNSLRSDQQQLRAKKEALDLDLETKKERIAQRKKTSQECAEQLDSVSKAERAARERLADVTRDLEQMAAKQVQFERTRDDSLEKLRNLGAVPTGPEFAALRTTSLRQVSKMLDETNAELKKFSHVNQRALDQFIQFSEDEKKFQDRLKELYENKRSIVSLLERLEQQKAEAIQHTFQQLNQYFSEIFTQLTSGGTARLRLNPKPDYAATLDSSTTTSNGHPQQQVNGKVVGGRGGGGQRQMSQNSSIASSSTSQSDGGTQLNIDNYEGVSILCSFTGSEDTEMKDMEQLSGGQKTLVALGLVFSIQRCDPAPFYLFDEVDAALDADYRSAVAKTIATLSEKAQFIVTTFRPELLETAQKFYGVRFDRKLKVSRLMSVQDTQAKGFVQEDYATGQETFSQGAAAAVASQQPQQQQQRGAGRPRRAASNAAAPDDDDDDADDDVVMKNVDGETGGGGRLRPVRAAAAAAAARGGGGGTSHEPLDEEDVSMV